MNNRPRPLFYVVFLVTLALDQATKLWVERSMFHGESIVLIPDFLNLTYVRNTGMAFGLFQGRSDLLAVVVLLVLGAAIWWARKLPWSSWETNVLAGLIVSGAFGNLTDRFRLGFVIDFVDAYTPFLDSHWPAFNVADSAISISMVWLIWRSFFGQRNRAGGMD